MKGQEQECWQEQEQEQECEKGQVGPGTRELQ